MDEGEESGGDPGADIGVYGDIGGVCNCDYGRIFGVIGAAGRVPRDRSTNKDGEGGGDSYKAREYGRQGFGDRRGLVGPTVCPVCSGSGEFAGDPN